MSISAFCLAAAAMAQSPALKGFYYGNDTAPGGHEWQSPDSLAYNKEQPRATFYTFESLDAARRVLPENSHYWMSLDGKWKFNWVKEPSLRPVEFYRPDYTVTEWDEIAVPSNWNIAGLQKDGSQKYGTPIYVNQPVIFWHQVKVDDWRGGVMRTPPENWTTYDARNEVGSYRRTFTLPADWNGRQVYINFDGVDSFFYLWINGRYVGFSKNSRNAARFNITPYLKKGENMVAVEVYRNSDGSFLEAQDMFRLPGIFRSVSLTSTSPVQVRDLKVIPDLTNNYTDGELCITTSIRNLSAKNAKNLTVEYSLYSCGLYSDDNEPVAGAKLSTAPVTVDKGSEQQVTATLKVADPKKWSAEQPWRYVLVAQLKDAKGKVMETVSTYVGFRKVEIKDTKAEDDEFGLAGRYFYVNGQPVKLKGVNRHETNPSVGHAISRDWMEKEVMMMKRANINHVRNSHYPDAPYWYYLADKYGIYLEDEANIESHEYYYGAASLSHVPEWEAAHVARDMELVHSTVNSPSVVIWSLGNEAGPGKNFVASYNAIKAFDTSRPVQYERNNDIVDMGSNQYPSIAWVQEAVKGQLNLKYPFHISEYAHSMGNAVGGLVDYWNAMESTNHFMGGAIWDWIDQSLYNHDPQTGDRYLAFGGDFGDNPSDGQFVMNGVVFGDMTPKPQYFEVKKVYQNVGVTPVDMTKGQIEIFNKNYFTPLTDYTIGWRLYKDGVEVEKGDALIGPRMPLGPREKLTYTIPYDYSALEPGSEYYVNVEFRLANDTPWAKAGYVQMDEQLPVKGATGIHCIACSAKGGKVTTEKTEVFETIKGDNFEAKFDLSTGTISTLNYGGMEVIVPGHGPTLDAFRAYMNNDTWVYGQWFANGLYNLKHRVTACETFTDKNGNPVLSFTIESQAPNGGRMVGGNGNSRGTYSIDEKNAEPFGPDDFKFTTNQIWTVYPDGSIELNAVISSNNASLILPRLGYVMEVPDKLGEFTYYGRGPEENYNDRLTGQFVGRYSRKVKDMMTDYTRPQSNANREEVRWAALTDGNKGAIFVAPGMMSTTAIPYTEMELFTANHPYKLPASNRTVLHLDLGVTGLGGASCGQGGPLESQRVMATSHRFSFIIRPATESDLQALGAVTGKGLKPLGISRDRRGELAIDCADSTATVLYTINATGKKKVKPLAYTGPIDFKQGGTITAWLKENPAVKATATLPRIETVPTEAIFSSSQEPDYGEGANLTDGDPSTIWHTMYSVTVAPYPHWVDFDAGDIKQIKAIAYLPRQDGNRTGNVKDYEIYVSEDGQNWGEPVAKGTFDKSDKQKTVTFAKPVRGRYVRFMALNAQDGRDYASGAEFEVIAD